jgi:hypothetical protein
MTDVMFDVDDAIFLWQWKLLMVEGHDREPIINNSR